MGLKQHVLDALNAPLGMVGAKIVPARDHAQMDRLREYLGGVPFTLGGVAYEQFAHRYNCGWPHLSSHTERSVELAVADRWLETMDDVIEIGAVTPYYWPGRVKEIVDPTDSSRYVTHHGGIESVNLMGRNVLSISTFEHIGRGDYGLNRNEAAAGDALDQLFRDSGRFLVTYASGYNAWLDEHTLNRVRFPSDVQVRLLVRNDDGLGWQEREPKRENLKPYGNRGGQCVFFLFR